MTTPLFRAKVRLLRELIALPRMTDLERATYLALSRDPDIQKEYADYQQTKKIGSGAVESR